MMNTTASRFLIMAGGTGGHVFPGLAVARELSKSGHHVFWLGTTAGIEADLVPKAAIDIRYISITGVRGKGVMGMLSAPLKIARAIIQSLAIMKEIKPQCVLGMGGFAAGPGAIAAKLLRIPLVIHEQNAIPGTTNRILSKLANKVLAAFPAAFSNAECVGNPVREGLHRIDKPLENTRPLHILVLGGSLGAQAINETIPEFYKTVTFPVELWHQTGKRHYESVCALYGDKLGTVKVSAFIDDMIAAYDWADIVICRAGAMTVSELAVAGLPAIFIPFPFAIDDHQTANANWMVSANAAILLPQPQMTVDSLTQLISDMNNDRNKLLEMKKNAAAMGIPDSAAKVAAICLGLVNEVLV